MPFLVSCEATLIHHEHRVVSYDSKPQDKGAPMSEFTHSLHCPAQRLHIYGKPYTFKSEKLHLIGLIVRQRIHDAHGNSVRSPDMRKYLF